MADAQDLELCVRDLRGECWQRGGCPRFHAADRAAARAERAAKPKAWRACARHIAGGCERGGACGLLHVRGARRRRAPRRAVPPGVRAASQARGKMMALEKVAAAYAQIAAAAPDAAARATAARAAAANLRFKLELRRLVAEMELELRGLGRASAPRQLEPGALRQREPDPAGAPRQRESGGGPHELHDLAAVF